MTVSQQRFLILFGFGMSLLGCALRIAGATGDLALDEVHSLMLLQSIHRADEVFWHINHDNNHFLNTLYLFFVGPDHSSVVLRLESIVLGTLSIPAAGLAAYGQKRDIVAAMAAMFICAVTYPAVHYGSEARGYAGLVLFSFLAIYITANRLKTIRSQIYFGVVILAGVLSHLLMIFILIGLFLWEFMFVWKPGKDPFEIGMRIARRFWAAILAVIVVIVFIKIGAFYHSFIHGADIPSHPHEILMAIDLFLRLTLGILPLDKFSVGLATVGIIFTTYGYVQFRVNSKRIFLYAEFLILYPIWMLLSNASDIHQPRYCMPMLAPLILLLADCASIGLRNNNMTRIITMLLLCLFCGGTVFNLARFYADGRGHYRDAVITMTKNGPATYTSDVVYGHSQIVEYYATRLGVDADFIPWKDTCVIPPDWLIHSDPANHSPPTIETSPGPCQHTYIHPQIFPYWGLTGWQWTLYRRSDIAASAVQDGK